MERAFRFLGVVPLAVSLACSAPATSDAGTAAPPVSRIRIATWNVKWLHSHDGEGRVPRTEADYARLARSAERLDADVVALQEIDGPEAARRVFDPSIYRFHFTEDAGNVQRVGFAIRKEIPFRPHPDLVSLSVSGARRGADVEIDLGARAFRMVAIHLKSGCASGDLNGEDRDCAILRAQLPALESWMDARAREGVPFVVLGDWNRRLGGSDPFWRELSDGDPPAAILLDAGAGRGARCGGKVHGSFVDHVVLDRLASRWLVPGSFAQLDYPAADLPFRATLSDHCPVRVELARDGGTPAPRRVEAREAGRHVGELATVCGRVASTRYLGDREGRPTFLNLERPHPHQAMTVVIWGDARAAFGAPESTYRRKRICVTGAIESHEGRPQVVAVTPSQIESSGD